MGRTNVSIAGAALLMVMVHTGTVAQQVGVAAEGRWQQRLELTEEQRAEIAQIREQHQAAALEAQAAMVQARADLQKLMLDTDRDLRELERAMNALSQLENAQKIRSIRNRDEIMQVLPEDQRQLFNRSAGILGFRRAADTRLGGLYQGRGIVPGRDVVGQGPGTMPGRATVGRGLGSMQGRATVGRGLGSMQGRATVGRGLGSMPGRAGAGRGWSGRPGRADGRGSIGGMMGQGRMIPPTG